VTALREMVFATPYKDVGAAKRSVSHTRPHELWVGLWVEFRHAAPESAIVGTDFIVARNGRIASVYLFFDNLP